MKYTILEVSWDDNRLVIHKGNKAIGLNYRQVCYLLSIIRDKINVDEICESCYDLGYLEVTQEDESVEIECCLECNYINPDNDKAKANADEDGIY